MRIEEIVNDLVNQYINDVCDLNIQHLACKLDIKIGVNQDVNCYTRFRGNDVIMLRKRDYRSMWHTFCHELGHMLMHVGRQSCLHNMFNEYQESQADKFALLLMMPERLIVTHKLYDDRSVSEYFNVSIDLARKRLEMLAASLKY